MKWRFSEHWPIWRGRTHINVKITSTLLRSGVFSNYAIGDEQRQWSKNVLLLLEVRLEFSCFYYLQWLSHCWRPINRRKFRRGCSLLSSDFFHIRLVDIQCHFFFTDFHTDRYVSCNVVQNVQLQADAESTADSRPESGGDETQDVRIVRIFDFK